MKIQVWILLLIIIKCDEYAVIVAGSKGYDNYRHQSDVCGVYQMLVKKGMNKKNIKVMMYNDVAMDKQNPFPGKLFNKASWDKEGEDVYFGCKIDYQGADVNIENFERMLLDLPSTQNDNLFIYFSDHGAPGLIAFPSQYLYEQDLLRIFTQMFQMAKYNKMVFYLETCFAASMVQNLNKNLNIYAVSAANKDEESWACYCYPGDEIQGKNIGSCLSDVFSLQFIIDSYNSDFHLHSFQQQFLFLQNTTKHSHVQQFGDLSISNLTLDIFFNDYKKTNNILNKTDDILNKTNDIYNKSLITSPSNQQPNSNHYLHFLRNKYHSTRSPLHRFQLLSFLSLNQVYQKRFSFISQYYQLNQFQQSTQNLDYSCLKSIIPLYESVCQKFHQSLLHYIQYLLQVCNLQSYQQDQTSFKNLLFKLCHLQIE